MPATPPPTKIHNISEPFELEHGGSLPGLEIAYETWGRPLDDCRRLVVVLHALSGSSHAFTSSENPEPGWWDGLMNGGTSPDGGPAFDPALDAFLCANIVGGCYGSTGPSSIDPQTGSRFALGFPQITLRDMIEAQRLLLRDLEVTTPLTLIGGSMGGMLVLDWAALHPDEVREAIALAAPARSDAFAIALRSVQRDAIQSDPAWSDGNYTDDAFPEAGLALARKIGMITYRSPPEFHTRFGRDERDSRPHFREGLYEVQSYLNYQGKKFVGRFDPNTYLYFSRAMDLFDLADGFASLDESLARIRTRTLLIAMSSDLLVPQHQMEEIHESMRRVGGRSTLGIVQTTHGHDAFLIEKEQILGYISEFFASAD